MFYVDCVLKLFWKFYLCIYTSVVCFSHSESFGGFALCKSCNKSFGGFVFVHTKS